VFLRVTILRRGEHKVVWAFALDGPAQLVNEEARNWDGTSLMVLRRADDDPPRDLSGGLSHFDSPSCQVHSTDPEGSSLAPAETCVGEKADQRPVWFRMQRQPVDLLHRQEPLVGLQHSRETDSECGVAGQPAISHRAVQ
jgi:hypothetical protein